MKKRGCLIAVAVPVLVVAGYIFYCSLNFYSVPTMQKRIARELPVGTPEAQVIAWGRKNRFYVGRDGQNVFISIDKTHSDIACSYSTLMEFGFNRARRLTRHSIRENSVCL